MEKSIDHTGVGERQEKAGSERNSAPYRSAVYLASAIAITAASLGLIMQANRRYAPEMYQPDYMETVADTFASGENYAVFDLNINIRKLRAEQWQRVDGRPGVMILGASQWQEAGASLMPNRNYLNGHVHRDYYEDVLGLVELLVRHDKLPKDLVITIRDRLFTPVAQRTDFLWLPGIPYYQAMADRLSLPRLSLSETYPLQRPRELVSLSLLFGNVTRWHNAAVRPSPTSRRQHATLDVLHSDGSITWSREHSALFTQERARKLAIAHADANRSKPPIIDPKGVEALDRLLAYLGVRGVRVHLVHPPFNPIYFDRVQNSPYMDGLREIEAVTRELAARHKLGLAGSFDPAALGCTAGMFIDAEHSNAHCLKKLLAQIGNSIDLPLPSAIADARAEMGAARMRSSQVLMSSGWFGSERVSLMPESSADTAADLQSPIARTAAVRTDAQTVDTPIITLSPTTGTKKRQRGASAASASGAQYRQHGHGNVARTRPKPTSSVPDPI